jgi:hypothetical protein
MVPKVAWPDGKDFAFTVFDDTDLATLDNVGGVYAFLSDCGFRTTKSCWVVRGDPKRGSYVGQTCEDADYLEWLLDLQSRGFEISWHGATWHGSPREEIFSAMEKFANAFRHYPVTGANHADAEEAMYWGAHRLTGSHAFLYNVLTRYRRKGKFRGHIQGDEHFWGDLCKEKIAYLRNFVFQDINTLKSCPFMPYHDPKRPYVNQWFASSNGNNVGSFNKCISEENQDRLEQEGGACIMYTHFASGFGEATKLEPRFKSLMNRLSKKNGWCVPVATLLDYLRKINGHHEISDAQRRRLERKWLLEKVFTGTN